MSALKEIGRVPSSDYSKHGLAKDRLILTIKKMMEIRLFEEKVEELYLMKGLITGPAHLYFGQEAVAAGVISALDPDDIMVSHRRGMGSISLGIYSGNTPYTGQEAVAVSVRANLRSSDFMTITMR